MYCGNCGYIIATRTETRYPSQPSYYFCTARREKGVNCKNGQFDSKVFDEMIYSQLFRNTALMEKVYNDTAKDFNLEEKQNQIEFYRGEIVKQGAKKTRVNDLYIKGFMGESEVSQEHTEIRNYTFELENNILKIENEIESFIGFDIKTVIKNIARESNFEIKQEFVTKHVDKIKIFKVDTSDIDYTKLLYGELYPDGYWAAEKMKVLKNPHGNDKLIYVEVFAFGNPNPLKITLTNVSKQCFISENLNYANGHLTLNQ